jgi:hypothetical protein
MKVTFLLFLVLLCAVCTFLFNFSYLQQVEQKSSPSNASSKEPSSSLKKKLWKRKSPVHEIAGLSCQKYGGPEDDAAVAEMVYWRDIPSDAHYKSPYGSAGTTGPKNPKYLTFEPDEGHWNNKRMSMETVVVMAVAMGRILVLPPEQDLVYTEIFHFDSITKEFPLQVITMEEFLKREGLTGNLRDTNGNVKYPPDNKRVNWNKDMRHLWDHPLWPYLREVSTKVMWEIDKCVAAFSEKPGPGGEERLKEYLKQTEERLHSLIRIEGYTGNPTPVDAPPQDRLREMLGTRNAICVYDEKMQNAKYLHTMGDNQSRARLLAHFYVLLFFEDWRQDLLMKRFVRDHFRYTDELQCAAARIVNEMRQLAKNNGDPRGNFETFHIRRGDFLAFQKGSQVTAEDIYKNTRSVLVENSTIYIATDERDKSFFEALRKHYHIYFMDDFQHLMMGLGMSKFGMLDQLVASRGRTFVGLYYSTFTGYINRMRAYHAQKNQSPGYEDGIIQSYFYAERRFKYAMRQYRSISWPTWAREFPVAWRDIDHDVLEMDIHS